MNDLVRLLRQRRLVVVASAPSTYLGVPVPETLKPNWDEIEADWWRRGVTDARDAMRATKS